MHRRVITAVLCAFSAQSFGQQISFNGAPLTETFDQLANNGTANPWTNGFFPLSGWYWESLTNAQEFDYRGDNGSMNTGDLYSYGAAAAGERALGALASGTTQAIAFGSRIRNDTSQTLGLLTIGYVGEQWRNGGNTTANINILRFSYRIDADNVADANEFMGADAQTAAGDFSGANPGGYNPDQSWNRVNTLDFTSPQTTPGSATPLDGNLPANRLPLINGVVLSGWQPGQDLLIRWVTINNVGNDHGLAVDDFQFNATVVPEPATIGALTVGALALLRRRSKG